MARVVGVPCLEAFGVAPLAFLERGTSRSNHCRKLIVGRGEKSCNKRRLSCVSVGRSNECIPEMQVIRVKAEQHRKLRPR